MRKPTAAVSLIKKGGHYSRLIVVLISLSKEQPWLPAWHSKYVFSCSPPLTCFPIHPFLLTLSSPLRIGIAQWIPLVGADWPAEWADWHPDNKLPLLQLPPQSPPSCPSPPRLWALSRHQLHDQVAAALSGCLYNKKTNMPTHTHLSSMIFFHTPPTLKSTGLSVTNLNKLLLLQRRLAQEKRESNANVLKRTILIYMRGRSSDPLLTCKYRDPEPLIATWFADYTEDIGIQSWKQVGVIVWVWPVMDWWPVWGVFLLEQEKDPTKPYKRIVTSFSPHQSHQSAPTYSISVIHWYPRSWLKVIVLS